MNLVDYILNSYYEDREILEELIKIDNSIHFTNYSYKSILEIIRNVKPSRYVFDGKYDVISDGELEKVISVVCNYPFQIDNLYVDSCYLGFYAWLTKIVNMFLEENGFDDRIKLDHEDDFKKYINGNNKVLIVAEEDFLDDLKKIYKDKDLLIYE